MGAATDEHLGGVVRRGQGKENSGAVERVGDTDTVGEVGQRLLSVVLHVVDHGSVVSDHQDLAVWESECARKTMSA